MVGKVIRKTRWNFHLFKLNLLKTSGDCSAFCSWTLWDDEDDDDEEGGEDLFDEIADCLVDLCKAKIKYKHVTKAWGNLKKNCHKDQMNIFDIHNI